MKKFLRALTLLACSTLAVAQTNFTRMISGVNLLTGVTTYVIQPSDGTKLIVFNAASAVSVTMAKGTQTGFGVGTIFALENIGAGTVTIGCTGCNINGTGNLQLTTGQGADIYSQGSDYYALQGGGGGGGTTGAVLLTPVGSQIIAQPLGTNLTVQQNLIVQGAGSTNGVTFPDSGTSAQVLSSNNTGGFFSGATPNTSTCYTAANIFQPLFSVKVSGTAYSAGLENFCNKDALGGYPSLDGVFGIIPITEIVKDATNCNSSTVVKGDQSGCAAGASSVHWNQILVTGTETGPSTGVMRIANTLVFDGAGGTINANLLNFANWPSAAVGGPFNVVDAFPVVVASTAGGSTIGATKAPDCHGTGAALNYTQTTHQLGCTNVALNAAHPMQVLACNGTNGSCPTTPAVTSAVINTNAIIYSFTLSANQLSVPGQCVFVHLWWKHSTGSTSTAYSWNVGGTGSLGAAVSGGNITSTATTAQAGSAVLDNTLHICRASSNLTYLNTDQWQFGTAQGGGSLGFDNSTMLDWTQPQQVNLIANVSTLTDAYSFWGAEVYYP